MSFIQEIATKTPAKIFGKEALEKALDLGVPTKKNENWKYTNLGKYLPELDLEKQKDAKVPAGDLSSSFEHIFLVNGVLNSELSTVEIKKLDSDNKKEFKAVKETMGDLLEKEFTFQLAEAFSDNVYLLNIEKALTKPIRIHHYYTGEKAAHAVSQLYIVGRTNSEASIVETHSSLDGVNFANNTVSVYLEPNARLAYTKIQELNKESSNVQNIRAQISKDANFESITIDVGAKLSRNNIDVKLNSEGAFASAHGLYALAGEQQSDTNSYIRHAAAHTESAQLYKGIMADKSHGIFSGIIRMDRDAQLCNSEQLNKNLLLSKGAHAHSRPQLEIFADDVKAAHGSTTGQLSEEELFYFQARGVSKEKAQKLLAQAFLNDVILKIKSAPVRTLANELVAKNFKSLNVE